MKVAGINRDGRNKGEIIELTPQAKAVEAVKDAIVQRPLDPECMNWLSDIKIDDVRSFKKGDALKDKWSNNDYHVRGSATCHLRHMATDTIRNPRKIQFELEFSDALDGMGQPDVEIKEFTIN